MAHFSQSLFQTGVFHIFPKEHLELAKIGVDTAEKEPLIVWRWLPTTCKRTYAQYSYTWKKNGFTVYFTLNRNAKRSTVRHHWLRKEPTLRCLPNCRPHHRSPSLSRRRPLLESPAGRPRWPSRSRRPKHPPCAPKQLLLTVACFPPTQYHWKIIARYANMPGSSVEQYLGFRETEEKSFEFETIMSHVEFPGCLNEISALPAKCWIFFGTLQNAAQIY